MNRRRCTAALAMATLVILATLCVSAAAQTAEDQIKKLEADRAAAVLRSDIAFLDKETSDEYTLININGQLSDKAQMLAGFKSGMNKLTVDDISDLKVHVFGDAAVVTGKVEVKGIMGGKDVSGQALFTRVFVKKAGHWQSVALQQTRISN